MYDMKVLAKLCGSAAIALMMSGCNQTPPDTHGADVKAINDIETQWNQDYAAKDLDKIAAHYADDAVLIAPGGPAVNGRDQIRGALKEMVADPALSLVFVASKVEVSKSGDLGYTEGSYKLTITDSNTHKVINDHGNYVTTYRKIPGGTWKAVADIASSAVPPAPLAPEHHKATKHHKAAKHHK
jgi:uncharacterized protein (TIGR02246 family)